MCGITTGGSKDCYWDCEITFLDFYGPIITNPVCLIDCFEEVNSKFKLLTGLWRKQLQKLPCQSFPKQNENKTGLSTMSSPRTSILLLNRFRMCARLLDYTFIPCDWDYSCQARVRSPKVQSPKVKSKRTWADTIITWATHPPHPTP